MTTTNDTPSNLWQRVIGHIGKLNFYKDNTSFSLVEQILATRIYIVLFALSVLILLIFTGTSAQTRVVTVSSPSLTTFEQLSTDYPSTLSCPCSQISIPYDRFLAFSPEYHQVCSSKFVSDEWILSLFSVTISDNYPLDFRLISSSQFQVLALFCRTANTTVLDAIEQFLSSEMISSNTLFRATFDIQIATQVEQLKSTTSIGFSRTNRLLLLSMAQNLIFSSLRTNFYVKNIPGANGFSTYLATYANYVNEYNISSPPINSNDTCTCLDTFDCKFPSGFFNWSRAGSMVPGEILWPYPPPLFFVSGMQAGCIPQASLLSSTLECFFNQTCLTLVLSSMGDLISVTPLNATAGFSDYNPNTLISDIFDKLMIESFHNKTDFQGYFEACAPKVTESFSSLFDLVYNTIRLNQFLVVGATNAIPRSQKINGTWNLRYQSKVYTNGNNSCSCGTSSRCTKPQGFYCYAAGCHVGTSLPNRTIPGLNLGCFPIDSILLSTLECLFDQSCIQMLIDWRLFDFAQYYLPVNFTNITALDPSIKSQYLPNTSLETIISQLFIEDWTEAVDYASHYAQCQPRSCIYTFIEKRQPIFIITNVVGLLGGLTVILRILVPPCVKIIRRIYHNCYDRWQRKTGENRIISNLRKICFTFADIPTHCSFCRFVGHIRQSIQTLNVYETKFASNYQLLASRIYLVLLMISIAIISLFVGLSQQTHSFTVDSPTETQFEYLYSQYSTTLTCPCSQIAIPYEKFIDVSPVMHQVCSSQFVSSNWSTALFNMGSTWSVSDWFLLSTQFRLLSSLCNLAKNAVDQSKYNFISRKFVNVETLPLSLFQTQVYSLITLLIKQTPASFRHTLAFVMNAHRSNQLQDQFMSSWKMIYSTSEEYYVFRTTPLSYNNNTCTCAAGKSTCWSPLKFLNSSNNTITFPGTCSNAH
ncbi:unnamed protein product [Rotaria sp. Silwood2]|nr:unnamed protein product [Rotaria sp. Silwood2]